MANPSQLYLLADHIKLSLLERQRAISLNLEPNSQDGHISRSLESFQEGIEAIDQEQARLQDAGDSKFVDLQDQATRLRTQYDDLTSQFRGFPTTSSSSTAQPNDPALSADFANAKQTRPRNPSSSSFLKRAAATSPSPSKSVRFTDNPQGNGLDADEEANRAALFPYRDDPESGPDPGELDNQQIHEYHKNVIRDQDEQLDRLGVSIGRQRDLSIQIGDELDEHVQMLDEVDEHVDRHQSRLDKARKNLSSFSKKAKDNKQLTAIFILIVVLVLLIIILR
ncbi:hypothetical protein MMC09_000696 [Bachmanniomyces sp. S44760]|nr:hypothetical protein [Bachmanniomyces sp. S44760]